MHTFEIVQQLSRSGFGAWGESIASRMFCCNDAAVLGRNVLAGGGEIDLIVEHRGERIAVEVRSSRTLDVEDPDMLTDKKRTQLYEIAAQLCPPVFRVDYVAVVARPCGVTIRWISRV